jgi:parallel beta-helix repeat protein
MNMRRFLICLLSFAALAAPTTSWEASTSQNLAITVTTGQAITAVNLSSNSFAGGTSSGTVIGAISVTMSPASPTFSGSLSLTGTNASQFQITEGNLVTKGVVAAGTYQINIVASEAGVTGSPFSQAETITGAGASPSAPEQPGPSAALYASPPYACTTNRYVATNGSDSNNGTSPSTPWLTIQHANDSVPIAGTCINVAPGTYTSGAITINHGGNLASADGYVVYRCQTLDGCHTITNATGRSLWRLPASYVMIDGFEVDCNNNTGYIGITTGPDAGAAAHHLWVLNSTIHNCQLSGMQFNNSEYYWLLHNRLYNNSSGTSGIYGSGISVYEPKVISGYAPTPQDDAWTPYHIIIDFNVTHDNFNQQTGSGNSDGNGIILDDWQWSQNSGTPYAALGLVLGNVAYHNGGKGIHVFFNTGALIANNTAYNNNWDTLNTGTWRSEISVQASARVTVINNIAWAVTGSGILANNAPFMGRDSSATNSWSNNIAYGSGNNFGGSDSYPTPANKSNTNPLLVNAPGNNFALQAASPAIGSGTTDFYLPPSSIDVGACSSALTACP